ncbi:hypothetical protein EXIGLDRAFT_752549 [Exidia glandulosa HHB12029]|uniref:Uncharacterized protein n=1 Tax=Exidia glandulosa HHB12029 TaxID=1314781 RepID=A0A165EGQ8_EXIGL|nr:hypothetical protein EXIGLDRAFT_752549 [Exidia glandulosa HHB12029]
MAEYLLTKRGLKLVNRNLDDIGERLMRLGRDVERGSVQRAAFCITVARMCRDEKVLRPLVVEYDLLAAVVNALKVECVLSRTTGLLLAVALVQAAARDPAMASNVGRRLIPAVVAAVNGRIAEDAATELCGMFLVNYLLAMLCVTDEDYCQDLVQGLLSSGALIGHSPPGLTSGIVLLWTMTAIEGPLYSDQSARPLCDLLLGVLRGGCPRDRLQALRGLYNRRRKGRQGLNFVDTRNGPVFDFDAFARNSMQIDITSSTSDMPSAQRLLFTCASVMKAMEAFRLSHNFGEVGVLLAVALLHDPLCFAVDKNFHSRYYFPENNPRACGLSIDKWEAFLARCAEDVRTLSPGMIQGITKKALYPAPSTFAASRQDLVDVLLMCDLMSRRDNAAAASKAGSTLRRTRDKQVKVYSTYILSTSALTVDIVTAYESIKTWGIPQPSTEVRDSAAYLMAVCNLGELPARSKIAKDVLMANYMAKMYNLICPVDSRDHQTTICVQIATKLLMEGPSLQAGFMDREMEHLLVDYKQASSVASRVWVNTRRSFLVPMIDTILANRESGWRALTPTSRAADWPTWGNSLESFTWTRSFTESQIQRLMSHVHGTEPRTIRWRELPIEVLWSELSKEPLAS